VELTQPYTRLDCRLKTLQMWKPACAAQHFISAVDEGILFTFLVYNRET